MMNRVLAETTKAKKKFINGKEKFKEYSVVFLVEGEKFKLRICLRALHLFGSAANSVCTTLEFTAFGSGPDAKPSRASTFCIFLSTTMVFAAVRTDFPGKNTRVYRNTVTCVTRVTSNRGKVQVHRLNSQHWEWFGRQT